MYCKICGDKNIVMTLLGINICNKCTNEITRISVYDENYEQYKNFIRIFFGYYISDKQELTL